MVRVSLRIVVCVVAISCVCFVCGALCDVSCVLLCVVLKCVCVSFVTYRVEMRD